MASTNLTPDSVASPAAGPALPPKKDIEQHFADAPLFMRSLPEEEGSNDMISALQSLIFEDSPDEVARNYKVQGNEYFQGRRFREAMGFYTQGIDAKPTEKGLLETLLINRAACNLALENNRQVLTDCHYALTLNPSNLKAFYRSSLALLAMERFAECIDCCDRLLALQSEEKDRKVTNVVREKALERKEKKERKEGEAKERERRKTDGEKALRRAYAYHGLAVQTTNSPPDNPNPPQFDPDLVPESSLPSVPTWPLPTAWFPPPPQTPLVLPVFLLYPLQKTSDLISSFHTQTTFADNLSPVFASPPPWDTKGAYTMSTIVVYCETAKGRLLKIPKKMTLEEVFVAGKGKGTGDDKDGVVLRDGLVSFVVLLKGEEERKWVEETKKKRSETTN